MGSEAQGFKIMQVFSDIYETNGWKNNESVSGHGSTLEATKEIREALPGLIKRLQIQTLVDIPCGDMNWMSDVVLDKVSYFGADIVPEIIERNRSNYGSLDGIFFYVMDITSDPMLPADLILCRDLLGHFSNADVRKALNNIKNSGAKYLLATTFPEHETSGDINTGEWRPINLASLFGMPDPIELINENCTAGGGKFSDKSLGLWRLQG